MNFLDAAGKVIDHTSDRGRAGRRNISLRTGCFCNPGAGEVAMGLSKEVMVGCLTPLGGRMTYEDIRRCVDGGSSGAVRISLGLASNFADVFTAVAFAREFLQ